MRVSFRILGALLLSFILGTLYAILVGLIAGPLRAPLIAWPVWIALFWFSFWKFNLLRFTGFFLILPVCVIGFELIWSVKNPGMNADRYVAFDRSHYTPGFRRRNPRVNENLPDGYSWGLKEILIGKDGFRADPDTGRGNPERCQFVLIGDSMIYGSGIPYAESFGPVLSGMGIEPCIFGVTGNSPVDYLATLRYVADRIDPGAHVAFYLYAYNDFVSLHKYFSRDFLSLSNWFPKLFVWAAHFDAWRQSTFLYSLARAEPAPARTTAWQFKAGQNGAIKILYYHDPGDYRVPKPLNRRERAALKFFFDNLSAISRGRSWKISVLIHPDESEIYANLARQAATLIDLDPRRADGLKICREYAFTCDDISRYIYQRTVAEGKNPYFSDNRHFSAFGIRILAEHYFTLTKHLS